MTTFEELDQLSSKELHDRAIHRAERHLDVRFLWKLLQTVPAAQAATGDLAEADEDIVSARAKLFDVLDADEDDELLDALRPLFIDYLIEHDDA